MENVFEMMLTTPTEGFDDDWTFETPGVTFVKLTGIEGLDSGQELTYLGIGGPKDPASLLGLHMFTTIGHWGPGGAPIDNDSDVNLKTSELPDHIIGIRWAARNPIVPSEKIESSISEAIRESQENHKDGINTVARMKIAGIEIVVDVIETDYDSETNTFTMFVDLDI